MESAVFFVEKPTLKISFFAISPKKFDNPLAKNTVITNIGKINTITMKHFMISMTLEHIPKDEFVALLPMQTAIISKLMANKIITSITATKEYDKVWITMHSPTEIDAMKMVSSWPVAKYTKADISELAFHDSAKRFFVPPISLN